MSTSIFLAGTEDTERVLSLMTRYHEEAGIRSDEVIRARAVAPLLDGSPHGAIWLIGPQRAPLGYVVVSFGWSVQRGGTEGWVEECYIRPSVRGRGIGTEVLHAVAVSLGKGGVIALHTRVGRENDALVRFCKRVGFRPQDNILLLTDVL